MPVKPRPKVTITEGAVFIIACSCVGWLFTKVNDTWGQAGRSDTSIAGQAHELDDVRTRLGSLEQAVRDCRK